MEFEKVGLSVSPPRDGGTGERRLFVQTASKIHKKDPFPCLFPPEGRGAPGWPMLVSRFMEGRELKHTSINQRRWIRKEGGFEHERIAQTRIIRWEVWRVVIGGLFY